MILIVDDKKENLFSLKTLLELHRFNVDTASSGEEALKKILHNNYALIITDVQMPGMDGFEVAEAVSGYKKAKDVPIIFLSAVNTDKRFITRGYDSGGFDYVVKPFDPDILLLKVKTFYRLYEQNRALTETEEALRAEIEFRKKAENELEKRVVERTEALQKANADLAASNQELQQLTWVACHDLQEPLRKIHIFSHIVKDRFLEGQGEALGYVNRVIHSSMRMSNLINDLLNFSGLSAEPVFGMTDLNTVLEGVLVDLELLIEEKGAQIDRDNLPQVEVVPGQFRQLFQNLLSNALKFAKKGEQLRIHIKSEFVAELSAEAPALPSGNYWRLTVSDNGIGFNENYLDKIFTIFQQLHGKEEFGGTGIGLAIVKKVVDKHRGLVTARSSEGKGAEFVVVIPTKQSSH